MTQSNDAAIFSRGGPVAAAVWTVRGVAKTRLGRGRYMLPGFNPAAFTTSAQRFISLVMNASNCSGF